ncbi:MAG: NADH-quinone oxidoreductase subunit N [Anaerolineae bacterium]|nr:NADH-quinone oxidoreductase subunit N [Anaerolineae bacterium]
MKLSDIVYVLPELVLLLGAALVFLLDILWLRRAASAERRMSWLPGVAIIVLLVAALAMIPSQGQQLVAATMISVDAFALFFKALALMGVGLVILTAMPYMKGRTPFGGEFYALMLVTALAISLAVSANNLILIYVSFEFLSITSYVLAGYFREDRKSGEAALKYFLYGATASAVMLYGMSLIYGATGTTDLAQISAALRTRDQADLVWLMVPAIIMLLAGFGFKASLVPFHQWAPDTYEGAPTPVTAFLSTASKATGFAILMRVFITAFGGVASIPWAPVLIVIAVITMSLGNLVALRQTNVKRLLAYSSIAQAGYILIGVAAASANPDLTFNGINGVLIYLLAYLFTNLGAFAVVIAIENETGKVEIKDYAGLIYRAPLLAGALVIFLLSLAGIPPTGGFLGKFFVFGAAVQSQMWVLLAIAAINTVVAAFYYLNIARYMFFTPRDEAAARVRVSPAFAVTVGITAVVTVLLGLAPQPLIEWASASASSLLSALP